MSEPSNETKSEPSGAPYGCFAAFILVACVGFILLFAVAWGGAHCSLVPECQRSGENRFLKELLSVLAVSSLLGVVVAGITKRITGLFDNWASAVVICLNLAVTLLLSWITFEAFMGYMLRK